MKLCLNCQENPIAKGREKYCSDYCQSAATNKRKIENAKKQKIKKFCANRHCQTYFETAFIHKRFCSNDCRQKENDYLKQDNYKNNYGMQPCIECKQEFHRGVGSPKKCPDCRQGNSGSKNVMTVQNELTLNDPQYVVIEPGAWQHPGLICPAI